MSKPRKGGDKDARPANQPALTSMFQRVNKSAKSTSATTAAASSSTAPPAFDLDTLRARIVNRTDKNEFEVQLTPASRAYLSYDFATPNGSKDSDEVVLDLTHTSVPKEAQGKGIAGALVQRAFEFAKEQNLKVRPTCSYIGDFVKKNQQWKASLESSSSPSKRNGTAAAASSNHHDGGGGGGKTLHKQHNASSKPTAAASSHASSSLHPSSASSSRNNSLTEHSGDKRHSPSSANTDREDGRSKRTKMTDETEAENRRSPIPARHRRPASPSPAAAASSSPTAAAAAAASSSTVPQHHAPLPFSPIFAKTWATNTSTLNQAQEVMDDFWQANGAAANDGSLSTTTLSEAVDDLVDLMKRITLNKNDLETRCIGMKYFFDVYISTSARILYLRHTIPFLLRIILDLPNLFDPQRVDNQHIANHPRGWIPILKSQVNQSIHLNKHQLCALLACSFFGLQAEHKPVALVKMFKSANFDGLWLNIGRSIKNHLGTNDSHEEIRSENQTEVQKIICIMEYFEVMRERVEGANDAMNTHSHLYAHILRGIVTFHRKVLKLSTQDLEIRMKSTTPSCNLIVTSAQTELRAQGTIEDDGYGTLQIDFANKFIGGGVLTGGCIQEEIRLTINPECLVSLLFTEVMSENESVTFIGAERFVNYTGYSNTFQFGSRHVDYTPVDPAMNRMKTVIVAIDAIAFRRKLDQYMRNNILREILKAYSGFALEESVLGVHPEGRRQEQELISTGTAIVSYVIPPAAQQKAGVTDCKYDFLEISTGNWGCGAFGGEVPLKTLIQLLAATLARRSLRYFTFGSDACDALPELLRILNEKKPTVSQLFEACLHYHPMRARDRQPHEYIRDLLDGKYAPSGAAAASSSTYQRGLHTGGVASSSRPPLQRGAVRHGGGGAAAVEPGDFDEDDPIEDFPDDELGYDSEAERVEREMEMDN